MTVDTALTIRGRIDELLAGSWTRRWALLSQDADLVDATVAAACADDDPFLAVVIGHAAEVGVEKARHGFPLARRLQDMRAATPSDTAEAFAAVLDGAHAVTQDQAAWLTPLVVDLIEHLALRVDPPERALLSTTCLSVLVFSGNHDMGEVQRAFDLCQGHLRQVWDQLDATSDLGALHAAMSVVAAHLAVFDEQGQAATHAAEIEELCGVALRVGASRAITQHQMILSVRGPAAASGDDPRALRAQSARLVAEYEATPHGVATGVTQ